MGWGSWCTTAIFTIFLAAIYSTLLEIFNKTKTVIILDAFAL